MSTNTLVIVVAVVVGGVLLYRAMTPQPVTSPYQVAGGLVQSFASWWNKNYEFGFS